MATRTQMSDLYWRLHASQRPDRLADGKRDLNSDRVVKAAEWTSVKVKNQDDGNLLAARLFLDSDNAVGEYMITQQFAQHEDGNPGYTIEAVHWFSDPNTALEFRLTYG